MRQAKKKMEDKESSDLQRAIEAAKLRKANAKNIASNIASMS